MRGILLWNGTVEAKNRMTEFAAEMTAIEKGFFTELFCIRIGKKNDETKTELFEMGAKLQTLLGTGCAVILEHWEIPESLPLSIYGRIFQRCFDAMGSAIQIFYGDMQGKQMGSLAAALQGKECMINAECVESRCEEGTRLFFAKRRVCSGHLNCRVRFVPEETVLVLSPNGREEDLIRTDGTQKNDIEELKGRLEKSSDFPELQIRFRKWEELREDKDLNIGVRILENVSKEAGVDLQTAKVVFVGGKGLRSEENFQRFCALAEKMGAAYGCTRPVAMAGWTDFSRVVGISGSRLQADVCVTFGVSGSAAFLYGTENTKHLIAINNDKNAPIFLSAKTGILEDCMSIIEASEKGER